MRALLLVAMLIAGPLLWPGGTAQAQGRGAVTCADLRWSADVRAANPDIERACRGVYEKDNVLYAQLLIRVEQVRGSTLTFRTLYTDGGSGGKSTLKLDPAWRVSIDGREYRVMDLQPGQQLKVYMPEDRFALAVPDAGEVDAAQLIDID